MIDKEGKLTKLVTDVGNNTDDHNGLTLFGRHEQQLEHIHSAQKVYPTLVAGVTLTTHATTWVLGTIAEIVPINTITNEFDIHEVLVEDVNTQDKTYELVLYYGAGDTEAVTKGKEMIIKALVGMALWFLASLILYTINPTFFAF